jgi:hypothetical protein
MAPPVLGRALHSSTTRLDVSTRCGYIVWSNTERESNRSMILASLDTGCISTSAATISVTKTAQVELRSERVQAPGTRTRSPGSSASATFAGGRGLYSSKRLNVRTSVSPHTFQPSFVELNDTLGGVGDMNVSG